MQHYFIIFLKFFVHVTAAGIQHMDAGLHHEQWNVIKSIDII